jgi:hypothetical protein
MVPFCQSLLSHTHAGYGERALNSGTPRFQDSTRARDPAVSGWASHESDVCSSRWIGSQRESRQKPARNSLPRVRRRTIKASGSKDITIHEK